MQSGVARKIRYFKENILHLIKKLNEENSKSIEEYKLDLWL